MKSIEVHGVGLYEHAQAGAIRFYAMGRPEAEPNYIRVLKKYLVAAYETVNIYARILDELDPEIIIVHHGIYVPQGVVVDLAKIRGIRIVTWTPSYRRGTFMFCEGDTYHKVMPEYLPELTELSQDEESKVVNYIKSRANASSDWIWFNKNGEKIKCSDIREFYKIPIKSKIVVLYTNVFWDAQLHFENAVYSDMLEWLDETIQIFRKMLNVHLIIRTHPAEILGFVPSRQRIDLILDGMIEQCSNISVIHSDDDKCSYSIAESANCVIIFGSKIGIELAALGKKVMVCGEAWAKGKGFTYDIITKSDYIETLETVLCDSSELDAKRLAKARAYAHWFFFKKMMPIELVSATGDRTQPYVKKTGLNLGDVASFPGLSSMSRAVLQGGKFELEKADYPLDIC